MLSQRGSALPFVIIALVVLGALAFFLYSQGYLKLPSSAKPSPSPSASAVPLKTEYQNPFEEKSQYQNPFSQSSDYQNPFSSLK